MASDWSIESLTFSGHALRQMFRRRVSENEVRNVVESHEVIADYPDDSPFPSRLLLGFVGARPLHIVLAYNHRERLGIVVTVYEPDPAVWEPDHKTRRQP